MLEVYIKPEYLEQLRSIFDGYCPNAHIWAYGSRVNGAAHNGSDLDLVVKDFGDERCFLPELKEFLNESNIPFLIDINEFDKLPEEFQSEVLKKYVEIYPEKPD